MTTVDEAWRDVERDLRQTWSESGMTVKAIDWILGDMRSRWYRAIWRSGSSDFPDATPEGRAQLQDTYARVMTAWLLQLMLLEQSYYQAYFQESIFTAETNAAATAQRMPEPPGGTKPN